MIKKVPMRTCVVTKEVRPKKDLIRVVATKEGLVSVDTKGKANGRGAYLILSKEVIDLAKKSKAFCLEGFHIFAIFQSVIAHIAEFLLGALGSDAFLGIFSGNTLPGHEPIDAVFLRGADGHRHLA